MSQLQASSNAPWIVEGKQYQGENASIPWSVSFPWATTVTVSTVKVFKKGTTTDIASTVMPSGSHSASGNTITLKPLTALTGGESYIISMTVSVDGVTDEWFMEVGALKEETGLL